MKLMFHKIYIRAILGSIFLAIILEIVERIFNLEQLTQVFDFENLWGEFILTVIIGPFIETLIIQIGLIFILRIIFALLLDNQETKSNPVLIPSIIVSSVIFGILPYYNLTYILFATFIGLYFGYIYYISLRRDNNPLFPVIVAHAVYNFCVLLLDGKF